MTSLSDFFSHNGTLRSNHFFLLCGLPASVHLIAQSCLFCHLNFLFLGSLLVSVQKQLEHTEENLQGHLIKVRKDRQDQHVQSETRLAQSEARLAQLEAGLSHMETRLVESDKGCSKLEVGQLAYLYESLLVKTIQLPVCVPASRYPLWSMKDLRDHVEDNKMDNETRRLIQEQIATTEVCYLSQGTKSMLRYLKDERGPGAHPCIDLGALRISRQPSEAPLNPRTKMAC